MLSKEERQARLKILIKVEKNIRDGIMGIQEYEETLRRDGFVISVMELLRGAHDSLNGSIALLSGNELSLVGRGEGFAPPIDAPQRPRLRVARDEGFGRANVDPDEDE